MSMFPLKTILCPTDFSDPSFAALDTAGALAGYFDAELCVVHVLGPLDPRLGIVSRQEFEQTISADAAQKLREVVRERLPQDLNWRAVIKFGEAGQQILAAAQEEAADLIVISTHGLTGWRHLVFGSVAEKVARSAPCAVLTIRAPRGDEAPG